MIRVIDVVGHACEYYLWVKGVVSYSIALLASCNEIGIRHD